ncbi:MAG: nitroreductase family protein [Candidatus Omnitrophica bacterium]|nr:nitroreductase family protein [Candidatus Omnitrophota bacterium]MCM8802287.1 nitroreductase family protein [Candidatus Omnitrophota bacterium]
METIKVLKERRSIRKYQKKEVPKNIIEDIIDCARFAPTAINIQPWEFIVITDKKMREKISEITDYGKFIKDAPVCVAVFCKDTKYYLEDGSSATTYILLAAKDYGLGSCWVAGDKKGYAEKIREILGVPIGYKLISLISIGYPDEEPKPKKRELKEVLHWEKW